jgi:hypothetical protein
VRWIALREQLGLQGIALDLGTATDIPICESDASADALRSASST